MTNDECRMTKERHENRRCLERHALSTSHSSFRDRGMILFEVFLALAIFAIAAVALVTAINQIGHAVLEARTYRNVEQGIESVIDEYSKAPVLDEVEKQLKPGKDGVTYTVKITNVRDLKSQEGRVLQGLFRIHVSAKWMENREPMELSAETMRFVGLFQPTG